MGEARGSRAFAKNAWGTLALLCALGSVGCGGGFASTDRSGQAGTDARDRSGQIDLTTPGGPTWPVLEPEAPAPELTDADVERIATRLPPSRVPRVSASNPSQGPVNAAVVLQIFSDFECAFCARAAPALRTVARRFEGRLRVVWRNYPLPTHTRARPAARAALAAFAQGGSAQFWNMHDWLFSPEADLSDVGLRRAGARLALDPARLERAVSTGQYDSLIDADVAAGDAAGIEGTPAVFINDFYVMGARHEAEYTLVIERALREKS